MMLLTEDPASASSWIASIPQVVGCQAVGAMGSLPSRLSPFH